ncbi:MAG: hypothetical protein M0P95_12555 [Sulfuritalea sp.]|nr:hypothetical protein [Sulfuritalea sp.]
MFQMNKKLFDQCWPAISAQIRSGDAAGRRKVGTAPAPSHAAGAEAGYVLGVAMGYALPLDQGSGAPVSASIPGWQVDACGGLNWPRIAPPAWMSRAMTTSRR